jgi:hypothetical protein
MLILLIFPAVSLADNASQTDWSGMAGVQGPVDDFGKDYYSDSYLNCSSVLALGMNEYTIDDEDGATSIATGDFDGDGDMDILVKLYVSDAIFIYENTGVDTAWVKRFVVHNLYSNPSLCSCDIDGDGDTDFVLSSSVPLRWYENTDGGGLQWEFHVIDDFISGRRATCDDVDDDGNVDVLCHDGSGKLVVFLNEDGTGLNFVTCVIDSAFSASGWITTGDIDGDGDRDVIGAAYYDDMVYWWENDGSGYLWTKHQIDDFTNARRVSVADIDNDGDVDVLGASFSYGDDNVLLWWDNSDTSPGVIWTEHVIDTDLYGVSGLCLKDADMDGSVDVLITGYFSDEMVLWHNSAVTPGSDWSRMLIADDWPSTALCMDDLDDDSELEIISSREDPDTCVRCFQGYSERGVLESSILHLDEDPQWTYFDWTSEASEETSVAFQVRASDDFSNMGPWSDTLFSAGSLEGILDDNDNFVQYKAILGSENIFMSPLLSAVVFVWNPLGFQGTISPANLHLFPVTPNPSGEAPGFAFHVPSSMRITLSVFDVSGRLIFRQKDTEYPAGEFAVQVSDMSPGIYFCILQAGELKEIQRFTVID